MNNNDVHSRRMAPRGTSDLEANAVRDISAAPTSLLADVFAPHVKARNFRRHTGPHFRDDHLLLDERAAQILATTDAITERVRKLGATTLRLRTFSLAFAALAFLPASAQAQAQSACAQAVEMARDNVALRINGGDNSQNSRESAKAHLDDAAMAAARGDEDRCWKLLYWSDYLIGIPRPVAEQMRNATATAQQRPVVAPAPSGTPASYRSR